MDKKKCRVEVEIIALNQAKTSSRFFCHTTPLLILQYAAFSTACGPADSCSLITPERERERGVRRARRRDRRTRRTRAAPPA
ncbi:hypothetical protein GWI33_014902 [Rhynchophorus ferrugineus]|uniref:Uncharacterized protein n=1 Tax=Rhynchophorus ferrugineus TaxID=354439 RepID=A0A834I4W5_RHYFE|nr:hypothetical protein GWI33_014902 [Rhynchophorus ferrugineus]